MPRTMTLKPSFVGGEISPRLYGRTDWAKYGAAAEAIENFIVRPEGGLMRRHGTRFAGESKDHTRKTRLQPFIFSTIQTYMLEFGHNYLRIWKDNAPVVSATSPVTAITTANPAVVTYSGADNVANGDRVVITGVVGMGQVNNREFQVANLNAGANTFELLGVNSTAYDVYTSGGTISKIYEIATPYTESDLDGLYFTQSADTLYIAHPSYAPRTLTRTAHTSFTLATLTLDKGPFAQVNTNPAVRVRLTGGQFRPGDAGVLYSNTAIFTANHVGSLFYIKEIYLDQTQTYGTFVSPWAPNTPNPGLGAQLSNNGNVYQLIDAGAGVLGSVAPVHTVGDAWDNSTAAADRKKWRYLHSRTVIMRITSFTSATQVGIEHLTYCPHGLNQPTRTVTNAADNGAGLIRITIAAGHQFGDDDYVNITGVTGTIEANGNWRVTYVSGTQFDLVGSAFVNAYAAGGSAVRYSSWIWAFGAFSTERGYPACIALHEQRLCLANTTAQPFGVWASAAGDYTNFSIGTADADSIAYNIAANQADPIRWLSSASDLVIGTLAQEYAAYGGGLGDPITPTNTRIVPQSGEGSNAVQPTKAAGDIMFSNRAGRKLFALRQSDGGTSYAAADLLELAEHLTIGKTIKQTAWAKNPASVLWVRLSDGALCSLTYRREQEVWAWARHPITGTVESIAVIPSLDGSTDELWLSIARTINGGTKRYIEYLAPPFEPTSPTDKDLMGYVDSGLRYSGTAVSTLSGLWHLEGQSVKVVANGSLHPDRTVSGGKITLDGSFTNVWAGLAFTSRVRTLRLDVPGFGGQGSTKRIPRLTVRVHNAIGGTAGPGSEVTMEELVKREANDPMDVSPPMRSGDYDVYIASDFDLDGRVAIVQSAPMPLDILAIMPMVAIADG